MFNPDLFLDTFVALFAVLNPLLAVSVFLSLTADESPGERQRVAAIASITTAAALCVAALIGDRILSLFGVQVPAFQVAGGIILLTIALGMLKSGFAPENTEQQIAPGPARPPRHIAVYPLAIPLIAGPGSFVTTIVMSSRVSSAGDFLALSAGIVANALVLWLSLVFAVQFARIVGQTVVSIGTPLLAILLAAIAVELVFTGIDTHVLRLVSVLER
jgi:multiple antibiotic resistance protein